ncbi:hypothetical protein TOPH_02292 [Tolypocladium ophioglossoides CBS 100239]|uniref:Uncharacterized protein n=1 Tax=Tolypocladium ophioglossoides (strain CBS 100239) TaxID=1163406 RepID=A0A0L0NGE9_TOLOC|nr:hypothetical protein TOPH_02292 [Tolypocladium ophioglossoides CBS 100239]
MLPARGLAREGAQADNRRSDSPVLGLLGEPVLATQDTLHALPQRDSTDIGYASRMPSTLARSPSAAAAAVAAGAPYKTSTSPMASRSVAASPAVERRRAHSVTEFDSSVGPLSPDPGAIPRRLPSVAKVEQKGGFKAYHKPIRPAASSSESTPPNPPPEQPAISRSSADETSETGIIAIGMALGSPTHPPDDTMTAWRPQFMTTVAAGTGNSQSPSKEDSSKPKPRKWGIFGRSKSKRGKGPDARQEGQPTSAASASGLARSMSSAAGSRWVQDNGAKDAKSAITSPRQKPIARSQTETIMGTRTNAPMSMPREAISPVPPAQNNEERSSRTGGNTQSAAQSSSESHVGENFLDVEIPDITMERYSVMFGHLLQHRSASSLLARRQATQDRIKAIKEGEANMQQFERRKNPSPGAPAIWGSTIPPMHLAPRKRGGGHGLHSRLRSNTSPAMLPSPSQSSFDGSETPREQLRARHIAESTSHDSGIDEATATSRPTERPQLISKFRQHSLSHQTNSPSAVGERASPMAKDDKFQIHVQSLDDREISPSTWNSTHPPLANPTSHSYASKDSGRSRLDSSTGKSRAASLSEEDPEKSPTDPVEVSIAKQITVSRQQRALLGPLQRHELESKRINETKSSTPRLVDPRQDPDSPKAIHRKSERVIVERA